MDWTKQGKADPLINNPGKCDIRFETTYTAVQNIFSVEKTKSTELQNLYRHAIIKLQIHSWEYMCSYLHLWVICSNNSYEIQIRGWHNIRQDKLGRQGFKRNIYRQCTRAYWL